MKKDDKIYVAGHRGMVGSAIFRKLADLGYSNIVVKNRDELNLIDQLEVASFFEKERPSYVFLAAAKVGGIKANNVFRADFLYENLMIQNNVIHESHRIGVKKLLFLGSSCIYPKYADQPIKEESLLTGHLEETNEPYAIAKIAGIKLCENYRTQYNDNFISAMPTNLYGPNDNYDLNKSHVLPALLRKFHSAKQLGSSVVEVWGSGKPLREFLHVDDLADACLFLMNNYSGSSHLNIGYGTDLSIKELAEIVKKIVGFEGEIRFNISMPDGTPKKLMDSSKIRKMGWSPSIKLEEGIRKVYDKVDKNGW